MARISELKAKLAQLDGEQKALEASKTQSANEVRTLTDAVADTMPELSALSDTSLGLFLKTVTQRGLFDNLGRFAVDGVVASAPKYIFPVHLSAEVMAKVILTNSSDHLYESHLHKHNAIADDRTSKATLPSLISFMLQGDRDTHTITDISIAAIAKNGLSTLIKSAQASLEELSERTVADGKGFEHLNAAEKEKLMIYARFFAPEAELKISPDSQDIAAYADKLTQLGSYQKLLAENGKKLAETTTRLEAIPAEINTITLELATQGIAWQKLIADATAAAASRVTRSHQPA